MRDDDGKLDCVAPGIDESLDFCPSCESRQPWAQDVFRAFRWQSRGGKIKDIIPKPSAALIEAVLILDGERNTCDSEELERIRAKK